MVVVVTIPAAFHVVVPKVKVAVADPAGFFTVEYANGTRMSGIFGKFSSSAKSLAPLIFTVLPLIAL